MAEQGGWSGGQSGLVFIHREVLNGTSWGADVGVGRDVEKGRWKLAPPN